MAVASKPSVEDGERVTIVDHRGVMAHQSTDHGVIYQSQLAGFALPMDGTGKIPVVDESWDRYSLAAYLKAWKIEHHNIPQELREAIVAPLLAVLKKKELTTRKLQYLVDQPYLPASFYKINWEAFKSIASITSEPLTSPRPRNDVIPATPKRAGAKAKDCSMTFDRIIKATRGGEESALPARKRKKKATSKAKAVATQVEYHGTHPSSEELSAPSFCDSNFETPTVDGTETLAPALDDWLVGEYLPPLSEGQFENLFGELGDVFQDTTNEFGYQLTDDGNGMTQDGTATDLNDPLYQASKVLDCVDGQIDTTQATTSIHDKIFFDSCNQSMNLQDGTALAGPDAAFMEVSLQHGIDDVLPIWDSMQDPHVTATIAESTPLDSCEELLKMFADKDCATILRSTLTACDILQLRRHPQVLEYIGDRSFKMAIGFPLIGSSLVSDHKPQFAKAVVIHFLELRRKPQRLTPDDVHRTMCRLIPSSIGREQEFQTEVEKFVARMLSDLEGLFDLLKAICRIDGRIEKLMAMLKNRSDALFYATRDDEIDELGIVLTLEEMLRIAEHGSLKRGAEDAVVPDGKRARLG